MLRKNFKTLSVVLLFSLLLSGCMYPESKKTENRVPYEDQVEAVQSAVEKFQKDNGGILPIKTKDMETPIYQKYPIDFAKISPKYMSEPPGNAFESGGVFQYVLVDVEKNPTVKIFDLRIADLIQELKLRIKMEEYPPYKERVGDNVFTLDFKKLGYEEDPYAESPYTNQHLPFVITGDGQIYVDYRTDLSQALQNSKQSFKPGEDIRDVLVKDSLFVPAYSLPYSIDPDTNEPVFRTKTDD